LWVYLLVVNIADLRLHSGFDLLPFIHVSEIPYIKYIPFVLAALIMIPLKEYFTAFRQKENIVVLTLGGLFILIAFISSVNSVFPDNSLKTTSRFFSYYILLILTAAASSYFKEAPAFIIKSFIYVNALVITGSLLDYYFYDFHLLLVRHFDRPESYHSVLKIGEQVLMRPMGFLTDTNLTAFSDALSMLLLLIN
jgi:hypothetical protein